MVMWWLCFPFQTLFISASRAHQRPGCVSRSVACSCWSSSHWECHVMYDWQHRPHSSIHRVNDSLAMYAFTTIRTRTNARDSDSYLPHKRKKKERRTTLPPYGDKNPQYDGRQRGKSDAAESPWTLAALSIEMKWDGKLPFIQCYPGHCPRRLWWSASYFIWAGNRVPLSPAEACVSHLIPLILSLYCRFQAWFRLATKKTYG